MKKEKKDKKSDSYCNPIWTTVDILRCSTFSSNLNQHWSILGILLSSSGDYIMNPVVEAFIDLLHRNPQSKLFRDSRANEVWFARFATLSFVFRE